MSRLIISMLFFIACLCLSSCGGGAIGMGDDDVAIAGMHEAADGIHGASLISTSEHYSMEQRLGGGFSGETLWSTHYQIDAGR